MLTHLNEAERAIFRSPFDVCVSGSGPAGTSLALRLAAKGHRVLLLEAGGLEFSEESNDVYKGTNTGLDYLPSEICRQRFFGGSSNHWEGVCHALDAGDFSGRAHVPYSGWPILKADLDPYFADTVEILDVHVPSVPDYLLLNDDDSNLRKVDFGFSRPVTRFGIKYRQAIESARNLVGVLDANLVDIKLSDNLRSVASVRISNYAGENFDVRARYYILCHGGIENPRTLLNANRQLPAGIGNSTDLVGRFFMEHPHLRVASALINYEHPGFARFVGTDVRSLLWAVYEPTSGFRDRAKVLNFGIRFLPPKEVVTLPETVPFRDRLRRSVCASDELLSVANMVKGAVKGDDVNCVWDVVLRTASEQAPNPASRIKLGNNVDRFGNRRVDIEWRLTELDKHTVKQSVLEVGRIMARKNLGRVRLSDWLLEPGLSFPTTRAGQVGGSHHMGTTRMAESLRYGVVDKNLRVFGIDNLYVAGSSVFPSGGHVNPTFTIVQLSLRLADHLHDRLG